MDYRIRREARELDSTGYVEIGPGRYVGKHWQDGFVFVRGDAFGIAAGILSKHVPSYDHLSMTDVPREIGLKLISEWRAVADDLDGMTSVEACDALNLEKSYREHLGTEIESHKREISALLRGLADACYTFYEREDWVCVLGM